jgi:hypothetical protein
MHGIKRILDTEKQISEHDGISMGIIQQEIQR